MAIEKKRACGYRKVGGLYLVVDDAGEGCHRLPAPLDVCPTCNSGIKQSRGWTWIDGGALFNPACIQKDDSLTFAGFDALTHRHCVRCPICFPSRFLTDRCGLLWIGERFYPSTVHFVMEATMLGISKRIAAIPRGFKPGKTWVLLAHPKACTGGGCGIERRPGIFRVFIPSRIEKLITQSDATAETLARLKQQNITPVIVPDDDPDHCGSVYDDESEPDLFFRQTAQKK